MQDVRFCLVFVATIMSTYFDGDTALEDYLEKYNDDFPGASALKKKLTNVFETIESLNLPEKTRVWRKPDLFTLAVELYRVLFQDKLKPSPSRLSSSLAAFYSKVDSAGTKGKDASAYSRASLQGTNHRGNRILRGETVRALILASTARRTS
jgi:hypothetical protein